MPSKSSGDNGKVAKRRKAPATTARPVRRRRPTPPASERWQLRLYIAGKTARAAAALENLQRICESRLKGRYSIEIVDLLENPRLAAEDQIVAIPTLVRKLPPPIRKIVGNLSEELAVLVGLQIRPHA